jgi:hypothetical protein
MEDYRLEQTNGNCRVPLVLFFVYEGGECVHVYMYSMCVACVCVCMWVCVCIYISNIIFIFVCVFLCCHFQQKMEAQVIFLNSFIVFSLRKRKFVVSSLFVDKETNRSYPLANGLSGLN